jgi:hypothetical protein
VEFKKVLLPLDGSPFSETPLTDTEELVRGTEAKVILLRVSEPPVIPSDSLRPSSRDGRKIGTC